MERPDTDRRILKKGSLWGAGLGVLLALFLFWFTPFTQLIRLSYDETYRFRPKKAVPEVVIIYLDNNTYQQLKQEPAKFDRSYIAALLEKLSLPQTKAKLVVLDLWYQLKRNPVSDQRLAEAVRRHGKVVMVAERQTIDHPILTIQNTYPPIRDLVEAGGLAGLSAPRLDGDNFVRSFKLGDLQDPGFTWIAATLAGSPIARPGVEPDNELWLNYYGPPGETISHVSFVDVLQPSYPMEFFKDKYVFVGSLPATSYPQDPVDEFKSPYTRWLRTKIAGVELAATSFLNLVRGDPLRRMDPIAELRIFLLVGILFGAGLVWLKPIPATGTALLMGVAIAVLSCKATWSTHVWFSWMYPVCLQLPAALLWSYSVQGRRLRLQKEYLEHTLTQTLKEVEETRKERSLAEAQAPASPVMAPAVPASEANPTIPEHRLVRRVGKGGYGEVWLATNAIGSHHVVKLIHRRDFNDDGPYEREFRGIQRFMPISRSHPGFVNILQVGRNDEQGFFYYVMEPGDDEKTGQEFDPATYTPKTLGGELKQHGALKAKTCVEIGIALAEALEQLHREKLIHRDIKPANIIFVRGLPKLADIGLVTHVESTDREVSMLGTDGFMAPEGPGSPSSDVYSLGKVLYEACMGLDRRRFPELPTALYDAADSTERMQLNRIILRACEPLPEDRYPSAAAMLEDLKELARAMSGQGQA